MKRFVKWMVLLLVVALVFPVVNLVMKPQPSGMFTSLAISDPHFQTVAQTLDTRCVFCHASGASLPFYAGFPLAKQLIQKDIADGVKQLDLEEAFADLGGHPVNEAALAKLEYSLERRDMPPIQFKLLHWDSGLSEAERQEMTAWIRSVRKAHFATGGAAAAFENEPVQPLPKEQNLVAAKVELGDRLYHEKRLSGDDTIACATCHELEKGGCDQRGSSEGINGQIGNINSPTTFNATFNLAQFWDGRAASLEAQADGPVNNPVEMGSNWEQALPKLKADPEYVAAFEKVYPDGLKRENALDAIAAFERSLVTPNSPFDRYLEGDAAALSADEIEGYALFKRGGCATCHVGKALGGQSFERMGLNADYFADRGSEQKPDWGRFNATQKEKDRYRFKVPTLRNVAITWPYFHDGSAKTLEDAVRVMDRYQGKGGFSESETGKVVAFLESLTGEYKGKPLSN